MLITHLCNVMNPLILSKSPECNPTHLTHLSSSKCNATAKQDAVSWANVHKTKSTAHSRHSALFKQLEIVGETFLIGVCERVRPWEGLLQGSYFHPPPISQLVLQYLILNSFNLSIIYLAFGHASSMAPGMSTGRSVTAKSFCVLKLI